MFPEFSSDPLDALQKRAVCLSVAKPCPLSPHCGLVMLTSRHASFLFGIVVVLAVITSSHAITTGEGLALQEIFRNCPSLGYTLRDLGIGDNSYVVRPWSSDTSQVCAGLTETYDFYGVHCSATGNVDALYMYECPLTFAPPDLVTQGLESVSLGTM